MHDLRGRPNNRDLVLEKRAVCVIGVPKLLVEDFPEWMRRVSVDVAEAHEMRVQIARHVRGVTNFFESMRAQRWRSDSNFRFAAARAL